MEKTYVVSIEDLMSDLKELAEEYDATLLQQGQSLLVEFANGQKFKFTVNEIL